MAARDACPLVTEGQDDPLPPIARRADIAGAFTAAVVPFCTAFPGGQAARRLVPDAARALALTRSSLAPWRLFSRAEPEPEPEKTGTPGPWPVLKPPIAGEETPRFMRTSV